MADKVKYIGDLFLQSGLAPRDGNKIEPFVQLVKGTTVLGQFSVDEAQEFGKQVFEAAEATTQDAMFYNFMLLKMGMEQEEIIRIIYEFRKFRREIGAPTGPTCKEEFVMPSEGDKTEAYTGE
jgi:hypothetical protein